MTLQEFESLTVSDLEKLDVKQLKTLVSEQGKKLNKRIRRIESRKDTSKIAVGQVKESGGTFGVKGKDTKKELILEAKREQHFQKSQSGTVKGSIALKEQITRTTGKSARQYGAEKRSQAEEEKKKEILGDSSRKLTKQEKKLIATAGKKAEKEGTEEYNDRVGEAWKRFKRWKEKNPAQVYAKEIVKNQVDEYAVGDRERMSFSSAVAKEPIVDSTPDVFTTVDTETPFD